MNAVTRRRVWRRADSHCEYCRLHQDDEPYYRFHMEHIVAKQHGGQDGPANLALACHHCNHLSSIDPRTGRIVRIFHPRRQRWDRHFRFVGSRIVGRIACGRATVALLNMNVGDRVELRKELM
jgi:5-methylcytosine-specific restriction endonuclease McrA